LKAPVKRPSLISGKVPKTGVRERKKAERRDAIKAIARDLFYTKGYDATTTLEIASRTGIAEGTLFLYAQNKQELLLMLVNDDLEDLTARTAAKLDATRPLLEQAMELFAVRYNYWAKHPDLSRQTMQAAMSHRVYLTPSPEMQRYDQSRETVAQHVLEIVRRQQEAGWLKRSADPETIAAMIIALFVAEVRSWLVDPKPKVRTGLARLERLLTLAISGVIVGKPQRPRA
jgi:AcrR family transcriptional regulator